MSRFNRLKLAVPVAVLGVVASSGSLAWQAAAKPDDTPSKSDVRRAERAASDAGRDVAAVRTELVLANQRAEQASVATAAAYEAWNAARWEAAQAAKKAKHTATAQQTANEELAQQRAALDALLVNRYEVAPDLDAFNAIVDEDSIDGVVTTANSYYGTTVAVRQLESEEAAAAVLAGVAADEAEEASGAAEKLAARAETAREAAERAEQAALREAGSVAAEKERLVRELARLEGVSVALATKRQNTLEERARQRAQEAAAKQAEDQAAEEKSQASEPESTEPTPDDAPASESAPKADPKPAPAPPTNGSAQAVIAFAKAQIGDRYVWGAAGPNAWDCSGLMMAAWRQGGVSLPHYSAGQYAASTPISSGDLRPGDLVFWGSSNNPSSIHHVALYVGNGQIVHAPRTGRPVTQESMYYWIPPNFFARP